MVGLPVARYMQREKLGSKMAGKERWNVRDKEFNLEKGLAPQDRGYEQEPRRVIREAIPEDAASGLAKHELPFDVLGREVFA